MFNKKYLALILLLITLLVVSIGSVSATDSLVTGIDDQTLIVEETTINSDNISDNGLSNVVLTDSNDSSDTNNNIDTITTSDTQLQENNNRLSPSLTRDIILRLPAGTGSFTDLQNDIDAIADGGTFTLSKNYQYDPSTDEAIYDNGGVTITKNIIIDGQGIYTINGAFDVSSFDGGSDYTYGSRIFYSNSPISITLKDITFINGLSNMNYGGASGGAICFEDPTKVSITGCTFKNNYALDGSGGAISLSNTIATIENSQFIENSVLPNTLGASAIFTTGTVLTIKDSTFKDNYLPLTSSLISDLGVPEYTGVIESLSSSSKVDSFLNISGTTFSNTNQPDVSLILAGSDPYTYSSGFIYTESPVEISDSSFNNGIGLGDLCAGALSINDNANNHIYDPPGSDIYAGNSYGTLPVKITNTNFTNIKSLRDATGTGGDSGAIFTQYDTIIEGCIFENIHADGEAGAINSYAGNLSVANTIIKNTQAADGNGGAIYFSSRHFNRDFDALVLTNDANIKITNTTIDTASSSANGGAIYTQGSINITDSNINNYRADNGGAIYSQAGTITIIGSNLTNGKATNDGGAIYYNSYSVNEGTQTWVTTDATRPLFINYSVIQNNDAGHYGGAVFSKGTDLTITHNVIYNNTINYVHEVLGSTIISPAGPTTTAQSNDNWFGTNTPGDYLYTLAGATWDSLNGVPMGTQAYWQRYYVLNFTTSDNTTVFNGSTNTLIVSLDTVYDASTSTYALNLEGVPKRTVVFSSNVSGTFNPPSEDLLLNSSTTFNPSVSGVNGVLNAIVDGESVQIIVLNSTATNTTTNGTDIVINIIPTSASINLDDSLTFQISVSNNGNETVGNVSVKLNLPSSGNYTKTIGTFDPVEGVWYIGELGASQTQILTTTVKFNTTGVITNKFNVTCNETEINTTNNYAEVNVTVNPIVDLIISASINNTNPVIGTLVEYNVTLYNAGPSTSENTNVTLTVPNNFEYISNTPSAGTSYSNTTKIWTIGNLNNGNTVTLILRGKVTTLSNLTFVAVASSNVTEKNLSSNTASLRNQVSNITYANTSDLGITVVRTTLVGNTLTYRVTVTNIGPNPANNVNVTYTLPTGLNFTNSNLAYTHNGSNYTWNIGTLNPGASRQFIVFLSIADNGQYLNTFKVLGTEVDSYPLNNTAYDVLVYGQELNYSDIAVEIIADNYDPNFGDQVTFTIMVTNNGPNNATNIVVTSILPAGLIFVSSPDSNYNTTTGTWSINNLAVGGLDVLTLITNVSSYGLLEETVNVQAVEFDNVSINNTATLSFYVSRNTTSAVLVDLITTVTPSSSIAIVNESVTYIISVTNNGPDNATAVTLKNELLNDLTVVSANGTYNAGTGVWTIGTLNVGDTAYIEFIVKPTTTGSFVTNFTANSYETDSDPTSNSANALLVVSENVTFGEFIVSNITNTINSVVSVPVVVLDSTGKTLNNGTISMVLNGTTYTANVTAGVATLNITIPSTVGTYPATITYTGDTGVNTTTINVNAVSGANITNVTNATVTDLAVSLSSNNTNPVVGEEFVLTINVTNNGPNNATNVVVVGTLPAGLELVAPSTLPITVPTLGVGDSVAYDILVRPTTLGIYTTTVSVSADELDDIVNNNVANTLTVVNVTNETQFVDLGITVNVTNNKPVVNETFAYLITVVNNGPSVATNVTITDTLPVGLTYVSATSGYNPSSGKWVINRLDVGSSTSVLLFVKSPNTGIFSNSVGVSCDQNETYTPNTTATISVRVVDANNTNGTNATIVTDLAISLSSNNTNPVVGEEFVLTINVTNNGPNNATNVVVVGTLPAGLELVAPSTLPITVPTLGVGDSVAYDILVRPTTLGIYTTTVSVSADELDDIVNNNVANTLTVVNVTNETQFVDLGITVNVTNNKPVVNETFAYLITVVNNGPSVATNVTITDTLPVGLTYVSASTGYDVANGKWIINRLDPGASASVYLSAKSASAGTFSNSVGVSADQNESYTPNTTATISVTVVNPNVTNVTTYNVTDLAISLSSNNTNPVVGEEFVLTINVINNGPDNATNVVVVGTLPAGLGLVVPSALPINIPSLGVGDSVAYDILVRPTALGIYTTTVSVSSDELDTIPSNNVADNLTIVNVTNETGEADLIVTVTRDKENVTFGETVTYIVTIRNAGPNDAHNIIVNGTIPNDFDVLFTTGGYDNTTGLWNITSIDAGMFVTLTVTGVANGYGLFEFNVSAIADEDDPDPTTNSNHNTFEVLNETQYVDMGITVTVTNNNPFINESFIYIITVTNNGPSNATNVTVKDVLPTGLTLLSATAGYDTVTGLWVIDSLSNGSSISLIITAKGESSGTFTNNVEVTCDQVETYTDNNTDSVAILINGTMPQNVEFADLGVTITQLSRTGDTVMYIIRVRNNGPYTAENVTVKYVVPTGLNFVSSNRAYDLSSNSWTFNNISANGENTIIFTVNMTQEGIFNNKVTVTSNQVDQYALNNTATIILVNNHTYYYADLGIEIIVDDDTPNIGDIIKYTIIVTNNGPDDANNVTITGIIPSELVVVSTDGSYNATTGTWFINNIAAYVNNTLSLEVNVTDYGTYQVSASVESAEIDNVTSNNRDVSTIIVTPVENSADLAITLTVKDSPVIVGQTATYVITATNNGPDNATNVVIVNELPSELTFINSNTTYDNIFNVWNIGLLESGKTISIEFTVNTTTIGSFANNVTISGAETDIIPTNNVANTLLEVIDNITFGRFILANITNTVNANVSTPIVVLDSNGNVLRDGEITVTLNGAKYTAPVVDGVATITLTVPSVVGLYPANVVYNGSTGINTTTFTVNATMEEGNNGAIITTTPITGNVSENVQVNFTVTDIDGNKLNGTITITVDGTDYTATVNNGVARTIVTLPSTTGISIAPVKYIGTDLNGTSLAVVTVNPIPVTLTPWKNITSGTTGETTNVLFDVIDAHGNKVTDGTVTLTVDGKTYSTKVNNGIANVTITLPETAGLYNVTADYYNGDIVADANITLNVSNAKVDRIIVGNVTDLVESNVTVPVVIVDTEGKLINNGNVVINLNGHNYAAPVNNGVANVKITVPDTEGEYNTLVSYTGDSGSLNTIMTVTAIDSSQELTLKVKVDPIIGNMSQAVNVPVNVTYSDGTDVATGTVTLTINGTDYTGTVTNGKANIPITLPNAAGTYPVTVTATNGTNTTTTITNAIVLDPTVVTVIVTADDVSGEVNTEQNVSIKLIRSDGGEINDGTITLTVDNVDYVVSVTNENVTIPITLPSTPGNYTTTINYTNGVITGDTTINVEATKQEEPSNATAIITINPIIGNIGEEVTVPALIMDAEGNLLDGGILSIDVGGTVYTAPVNNGIAYLTLIIPEAPTISTVTYDNGEVSNTTTTPVIPITPVEDHYADVGVEVTVDNNQPTVGNYVTYTINVFNNGPDTAHNVTIKEVLPTGLTVINATENYTNGWTLNELNANTSTNLTLTCEVTTYGAISTVTTVNASEIDTNTSNNKAVVSIIAQNKTTVLDTILVMYNLTETYGDGEYEVGTLTDINGNPIPGQHIAMNLTRLSNGQSKIYWATTDYQGHVMLQINLAPGNYTSKAYFDGITMGNITYNPSESQVAKIIVNAPERIPTIINLNNYTGVYHHSEYLTGNLTDIYGNPLGNQIVGLNMTRLRTGENKVYWVITQADGSFKRIIDLRNDDYTCVGLYAGDDVYLPSESSLATMKVVL